MATYHVSPALGNDTTGDGTIVAPWATIGKASTIAVAGDIVKLRAAGGIDENPAGSATLINTNNGTTTAQIRYVGVNSSWEEDGSMYTISGANRNAGQSILSLGALSVHNHFKNIKFTNAKGSSIAQNGAANRPQIFENCIFTNSAAGAFTATYGYGVVLIRCILENSLFGAYRASYTRFYFCTIRNNTQYGISEYHGDVLYHGCIFHNNGTNGIWYEVGGNHSVVSNCVFNGNGLDGIFYGGGAARHTILGSRFTNNGRFGINFFNSTNINAFVIGNFFDNNTSGAISDFARHEFGNVFGGNQGYVDAAAGNFNLTASASLRRTPISLPA